MQKKKKNQCITKINSMNHIPKCNTNKKLQEENIGKNLCDLSKDFLDKKA